MEPRRRSLRQRVQTRIYTASTLARENYFIKNPHYQPKEPTFVEPSFLVDQSAIGKRTPTTRRCRAHRIPLNQIPEKYVVQILRQMETQSLIKSLWSCKAVYQLRDKFDGRHNTLNKTLYMEIRLRLNLEVSEEATVYFAREDGPEIRVKPAELHIFWASCRLVKFKEIYILCSRRHFNENPSKRDETTLRKVLQGAHLYCQNLHNENVAKFHIAKEFIDYETLSFSFLDNVTIPQLLAIPEISKCSTIDVDKCKLTDTKNLYAKVKHCKSLTVGTVAVVDIRPLVDDLERLDTSQDKLKLLKFFTTNSDSPLFNGSQLIPGGALMIFSERKQPLEATNAFHFTSLKLFLTKTLSNIVAISVEHSNFYIKGCYQEIHVYDDMEQVVDFILNALWSQLSKAAIDASSYFEEIVTADLTDIKDIVDRMIKNHG